MFVNSFYEVFNIPQISSIPTTSLGALATVKARNTLFALFPNTANRVAT